MSIYIPRIFPSFHVHISVVNMRRTATPTLKSARTRSSRSASWGGKPAKDDTAHCTTLSQTTAIICLNKSLGVVDLAGSTRSSMQERAARSLSATSKALVDRWAYSYLVSSLVRATPQSQILLIRFFLLTFSTSWQFMEVAENNVKETVKDTFRSNRNLIIHSWIFVRR